MDTVLVTGGTRGLGLAICKRLIYDGFKVIAVGRNYSKELDEAIGTSNGSLHFESFDMSDIDAIHTFCNHILNKYGRTYGLVNNAAIGLDGVLGTQHEQEIELLIRVNLLAPIILTKYLSRQMMVARRGRIINISSIISSSGFSGLSVYGASKAGLIGFTKSLSRELGKVGILVNAVAPGYMETAMTSALKEDKLDKIIRRSPLGKLANIDDVATTVSFLLGPGSCSITGTTITVDAGSTA